MKYETKCYDILATITLPIISMPIGYEIQSLSLPVRLWRPSNDRCDWDSKHILSSGLFE